MTRVLRALAKVSSVVLVIGDRDPGASFVFNASSYDTKTALGKVIYPVEQSQSLCFSLRTKLKSLRVLWQFPP